MHSKFLRGLTAVIPFVLGAAAPNEVQPTIGHRAKSAVTVSGMVFHDLDGNGRLTPYEDWRLTNEERARDLLSRMTLEEKAGLLMHGTPPQKSNASRALWDLDAMRSLIQKDHIAFFIHRASGEPATLAEMANSAQQIAEESRLGIPLTFSSDPRNSTHTTFGMNVDPGGFSLWPEPPGLAAIGEVALVYRAAQTASAEYRAIGIRMALSPQADLASEPRWSRVNGTFGDDPAAVGRYTQAYIEGFQGGSGGIGRESVATVVKHWAGYGAEPDGYDAHNPYGRKLAFPGGAFATHVLPFEGAFAAKVAGVMPTYGEFPAGVKFKDQVLDPVGGAFNKPLLTNLLRDHFRFDGIVLSDWMITDDCADPCQEGTQNVQLVGMPWGAEKLSKFQRFRMALEAGVDQFGGVMDSDIIVSLVREGSVPESRIDGSVLRLLTQTFALGLFENPYVDPQRAAQIVGLPQSKALAEDAQRRSIVLLKNQERILPLKTADSKKVWLWKVSPQQAADRGMTVVDRIEDAQVAILHIAAPYTSHEKYFFGSRQHEGSLAFPSDNADRMAIEQASRAGIPLVVFAYLDRPAILTPLLPSAAALLVDFGVEDSALLDVVIGKGRPEGRLPFELPSSEAAVEQQLPDVPSDSKQPLFRRGAGFSY